jgi:hypothetical protein
MIPARWPWWTCPRCLVREFRERLRWLVEWEDNS